MFQEFLKHYDFTKSVQKFTQFLNFVCYKYNQDFDTVMKDFQDYMAWPLKGCVGFNMTPPFGLSTGQQMSTFSFTYRPRDSLLINREQNIIWTYKSNSGPDVTVSLSCIGQFKRAN